MCFAPKSSLGGYITILLDELARERPPGLEIDVPFLQLIYAFRKPSQCNNIMLSDENII